MSIFFPNNAGTVRFNSGSATINGTGTLFKSYRAGSTISIPGVGSMQLAVDPTSDTVATGSVSWGSATTTFRAFEYHARNEEGVFSDTFVQLLNALRSGNIPAFAGLDGSGGDKGVLFTGAGTATTFALTASMRQLADDPDFLTMRATLGADNAGNLVAGLLGNDRLPDRLQQNSGFIPGGNYNAATKAGFYSGTGGSAINGPPGSGAYGPLIVGNRSGGAVITQLAMYGAATSSNEFYMRSSGDAGVTWSSWISVLPIRGSNANGWYVRFPDGTQICGRDGSVTLALNNAYGPLFWGDIPLTFPIAFSAPPIPFGNVKAPGGVNWASVQPPSTSGFTLRAMDAYNVAAATINYSYGAIGRWLP